MGKTKRSNNFLLQGGILAMAGIIVRLIGMLYRVPLTGIIGNRGNGYYSAAYEIYSMVLLVSSYSIPLALSKEMSAKIALGQYKNAKKVFHGALCYAIIVGIIGMGIAWFLAPTLGEKSAISLKVLSPTIF
ncbi:MAG TPA: polysaccharide biosynthesis protein, partial [Lachnospiraceae bacterium]|nr:polysaccharide biosynthesis protein [Lachnospiraceae bacterium]